LSRTNGVPQGSVLGPLLFSLFINDLHSVLQYCLCHLFADDVKLYLHHDWYRFEDGVKLVNSDLKSIYKWPTNNKLILNAEKSKAMVISESEIDIKHPCLTNNPIMLNNEEIHYIQKAKILGLWINNTLTWSDQASEVEQRVYGGLRSLWNCGPYLPSNKRAMLVKTLLLPHFTYGDSVMCDLDARSANSLQVAMNACIRFAFKMKRRDHISSQEKSILGCTYPNYRKYKMCLLIRNVLITKQPDYLFELLQWTSGERNPSLIVPRAERAILKDSFFIQATLLWNSLPLDLKRKMSSASFANSCLQYFSNEP
jgi:hypothetical protein